jgi:hypothetical protein
MTLATVHVLAHRLGRKFRVDTGWAEKQQLADSRGVSGANDVELDGEIVRKEIENPHSTLLNIYATFGALIELAPRSPKELPCMLVVLLGFLF